MLLSYLRSILRKSFFDDKGADFEEAKKKVLLTRPKNLFFERYVFKFYQGILDFIKI